MTLAEISQIFQSASVIIASLFAIYGFDAWRREHIGKRQIELAEEVLALFYQARDAIEQIRSPFGFGGEGSSRKPQENEKPEHKQALDQAYVLIERYSHHSELFSKLHSLRYRFMAQVNVDAAAPFDALNRIVNELIISAHKMARLSTIPEWSLRTPEAEQKHRDEFLKVHDIYYGTGGEDDPITPKVQRVVDDIERTCRAIIESKGTLYALFNIRFFKRGVKR
jgi:hypothetical protein